MNRRRFFLSSSYVAASAYLGLPACMLAPVPVAAKWPADAFFARQLEDALAALTGNSPVQSSVRIEIDAQPIAEDGSSVPVRIRSHLPNTRTITVLSEKNPNPVVARYRIGSRLEPFVSTRIKMGGTGDVIALIETDGGFYRANRRIQVTAGGCA